MMSWATSSVCEDPNTHTHTANLLNSQFQGQELQSSFWICPPPQKKKPTSETKLSRSGQEEEGQEERRRSK